MSLYKGCRAKYINDVKTEDACYAADALDDCLAKAAKDSGSKILNDYVDFAESEGKALVKETRAKFPDQACKKQ